MESFARPFFAIPLCIFGNTHVGRNSHSNLSVPVAGSVDEPVSILRSKAGTEC